MERNHVDPIAFYNTIQSFKDLLKTDVKIVNEAVLRRNEDAKNPKNTLHPGCSIQVEISNIAPIEEKFPMIVFVGVGLGVQFPETMPNLIKKTENELNFVVDLSNAPQESPSANMEINRVDSLEFETITIDEQDQGYVLFPGRSIRYKFNLTYKECPDIKQVKLFTEGTISMRHLFHYVNEVEISNQNIVSQL
jgi:hypothetical protein